MNSWSASAISRRKGLWLVLSSVCFGLCLWLALPRIVVVMDDDFWYLKSVVETFQRGRPWTADWLTPWAATSSISAALLTKLTGSFSFGVHFTLALAAVAVCWGMASYLQSTGGRLGRSAWLPWLVLGTPTVTFMLLMFTSVPIYLACLWWCLYLASKKRWGWFFVVWSIGFASRQSAIVWLSIPAWHWLVLWWENPGKIFKWDRGGWKLLAVLAGGVAMLLLMKLGMNKTHGQEEILTMVTGQLNVRTLSLPLSLGVMALAAGCGIGLLFKPGNRPRFTAVRVLVALVLIPVGITMAWWALQQMVTTHACYGDSVARAGFAMWAVMAALGLTLWGRRPLIGLMLTGVGSVLLVSLYAGVFDYYYIDAFCFAFAAGYGAPMTEAEEKSGTPMARSWTRWLVLGLLGVFLLGQQAWNVRGYMRMKHAQDRYVAVLELAERNVRNGKLDVSETGFAGFGYSGWKLEDYLRTHDGAHRNSIGGFVEYSRASMWNGATGVGVVTAYPKWMKKYRQWLPSHNAKGLSKTEAEELDRLSGRLLWFWTGDFALKRVQSDPPVVPLADYEPVLFPLNDEEWMAFLKRP